MRPPRTMGGMALPLPSPRAALDLTRSAVGLPARAFRVLDDIEALVKRVDGIVDRAEEMLDRFAPGRQRGGGDHRARPGRSAPPPRMQVEEAAKVSAAAGIIVAESQKIAEGAGTVVARASWTAERADDLLTAYEPALRRGAPMANRFVEQLSRGGDRGGHQAGRRAAQADRPPARRHPADPRHAGPGRAGHPRPARGHPRPQARGRRHPGAEDAHAPRRGQGRRGLIWFVVRLF